MQNKERDKDSYISRWDINLTDQDIEEIFDSDGIIGICMHDGRMPGKKFKELVTPENRKWGSKIRIKRLHEQLFLSNVFHVVRINLEYIENQNKNLPENDQIDLREAWKTVALGSDMDGIIDPFDNYNTAATLLDFKVRCKDAIQYNYGGPADGERSRTRILHISEKASRPFTQDEFERLKLGYRPEEIVDMIFYTNIDTFCKTYFSETYLNR